MKFKKAILGLMSLAILFFSCSDQEDEIRLPDPCETGCYVYNGIALDTYSGVPIDSAQVLVYEEFPLGSFMETRTDDDGRFSIAFPLDSLIFKEDTNLKFILKDDRYTNDGAGNRAEVPFFLNDFGPIDFELRAYPRATLHLVFNNPFPERSVFNLYGFTQFPVDYRDILGLASLFNEREEQFFEQKEFYESVPSNIRFYCHIKALWSPANYALDFSNELEVSTGDTLTLTFDLHQ